MRKIILSLAVSLDGFIGRAKLRDVLEQRELNNFRRVLQIQIDKNHYAQLAVEIIDEF